MASVPERRPIIRGERIFLRNLATRAPMSLAAEGTWFDVHVMSLRRDEWSARRGAG